ncbi:MAG: TIM barrel protein [Candidatus Woesearchaeota archaeon]
MNVKLGPGGTSGLGYEKGIEKLKELGLNALEVEFTYGVRMSDEKAKIIGKLAKKNNIKLSVHAPYYINLASDEKEKVDASITRILDSCKKAHYLNAEFVVFHAGFYQNKTKIETYKKIKNNILLINDLIKKNNLNVKLAPETTGKHTQFGSIEELLNLYKEINCYLCIDFAHIYARQNGVIDYDKLFKETKVLPYIHSHFSGIEFTQKGEKKHLVTDKELIKPLIKSIIKHNLDITIINESPEPFLDSVKTKKILDEMSK